MADKEGPLAKPSQNDSEKEDPGISMVDVLQDEESLEADAKAVLGKGTIQHGLRLVAPGNFSSAFK